MNGGKGGPALPAHRLRPWQVSPIGNFDRKHNGCCPHTPITDTCPLTTAASDCYAGRMALSGKRMLEALSRMPFVDTAELAMTLGEAHVAIHRGLTCLLAEGMVGRVSHGTSHLPSSRRYYLTAQGIREAAGVLGFDTASDYVRAYPVSREWLTLLTRRMDAVASVYRLAASLSPGIDRLRTQVDFHRRGRFDAVITPPDGRSFGVVRQGIALRRRSLNDRLRAIAEYGYRRRPGHCRNSPARHVVAVAPSGRHHHRRRHVHRLNRPFPEPRPSGAAAQSRPSVGYHYQVTDYVVHADATFWLSLALRSDPGKLPPMPGEAAKPPSSRCWRSSKVRHCSTPPSVRAIGGGVPAIRR